MERQKFTRDPSNVLHSLNSHVQNLEPTLRFISARAERLDVRYWHKADIGLCAAHVCFWG